MFVYAGYNCVDIRFDDKTALIFAIEPAFTLENRLLRLEDRRLASHQALALIHSESHRLKR